MGLAQVLIDEGRDEGSREGRFRIVLRQLTRRFGILPPWARQRLEAASSELLEIWADQLLDAASLEEALREQSKESNPADCQSHL